MHPRQMLRELERAMPDGAMVSTDIGNICSVSNSYLRFERPRSMFAAMSFGNCGYAFPTIMGAKVAAPDRAGDRLRRRRCVGDELRRDPDLRAREHPGHRGGVQQRPVGRREEEPRRLLRKPLRRREPRPAAVVGRRGARDGRRGRDHRQALRRRPRAARRGEGARRGQDDDPRDDGARASWATRSGATRSRCRRGISPSTSRPRPRAASGQRSCAGGGPDHGRTVRRGRRRRAGRAGARRAARLRCLVAAARRRRGHRRGLGDRRAGAQPRAGGARGAPHRAGQRRRQDRQERAQDARAAARSQGREVGRRDQRGRRARASSRSRGPVGVVAAITPSTNPGATPANNIVNALKGRNAIIVAPSPKGAAHAHAAARIRARRARPRRCAARARAAAAGAGNPRTDVRAAAAGGPRRRDRLADQRQGRVLERHAGAAAWAPATSR